MSPMNNRRMTPMAEPGVLDFAPGAAAAYSLRNLSLSYAAPVVTVRRSTDNAEADFTATEVSGGTLAGWAGADGFVKTWWDQSGNARHATQATAGYQPQIVDSGVLVTEGGKAAVRFDGLDDHLAANSVSSVASGVNKPLFIAAVFAANPLSSATRAAVGFGRSSTNNPVRWLGAGTSQELRFDERNDANTVTSNMGLGVATNTSEQSVTTGYSDGLSGNLHLNGAFVDSHLLDLGSITLNQFSIGALPRTTVAVFWDGTISEAIIYPTDQTALRTRIEGNLAWTYNA